MPQAVALNIMTFNIARTAVPAIGGIILTMAGPRVNFAMKAASYLALLPCCSPGGRRSGGGDPNDAVLPAMRTASSASHAIPVRRVLLRSMCFGFCSSVVVSLMALVAPDLLSEGPTIFGLLMGCMGVGAVLGADARRASVAVGGVLLSRRRR